MDKNGQSEGTRSPKSNRKNQKHKVFLQLLFYSKRNVSIVHLRLAIASPDQ